MKKKSVCFIAFTFLVSLGAQAQHFDLSQIKDTASRRGYSEVMCCTGGGPRVECKSRQMHNSVIKIFVAKATSAGATCEVD